jgi:hypothetical protein
MSTPLRPTREKNPHRTFNNKQSHHDLYEILTYNIPEFHKYLKKNINSQSNNPYINIKQKAYIYDGETQTNSDKGEYIIEFIDYNRQKNSLFPKNIFKDVHFTLHKYSSMSNKLHFRFEEFKNKNKYTLDLEYEDNQIYIKKNQYLNKFYNNDIKTCKMIIQAINNYISDTISEKEEKCRQIRNNMPGRKRGRVNFNSNSNPNLSNRLFGENLEEGEIPSTGGTKQKKKKIKLNTIKKQDLIEICKKNKLKGYSKLNKEQLIKFVKKNI